MDEACCTCATLLLHVTPLYDEKTEKPVAQDRRLDCCRRVICGNCIHLNPRFATYCPFCQISSTPSSPPQGLRTNSLPPPPYTPPSSTTSSTSPTHPSSQTHDLVPPSYLASLSPTPSAADPSLPTEKGGAATTTATTIAAAAAAAAGPPPPPPADDVLHFLDHDSDTLAGVALRYGVPLAALRRANSLAADHLLLARRTLLIPGAYYRGGVSLSPRPVGGEEEERRKAKVFRFQRTCKVAEYDVALLYLKQAEYDLEMAINIYKDDVRWEREHPIAGKGKGKDKTGPDAGRRRFTGQRS